MGKLDGKVNGKVSGKVSRNVGFEVDAAGKSQIASCMNPYCFFYVITCTFCCIKWFSS